jgi:asparagine synthase (glutamine-hydrolysing)
MCGIGGVLFHADVDGAPRVGQPPRWTQTLLDRLRHRGPDGDGVFVDDGVLLAHTRLALVDTSDAGKQPLTTPDGRFVLVVNGEVYNHQRLRPQLVRAGAVFRSRCDAEVLLWLLALRGVAGLDDVEGEYAFCFFDRAAKQALLGRDTLGVKPLVWCNDDDGFWFASEAQALLAVRPRRRVLDELTVVTSVIAPAFSGERVPFAGVQVLPPGTTMCVDGAGVRVVRARRFVAGARRGASTSTTALAQALQAAVDDRLDADVPVGAFVSGGLDSSAIVAAARQSTSTNRLSSCFTIRFDHHVHGPSNRVTGSIVVDDDAAWVEPLAMQWQLPLSRVHVSQAMLLDDIEGLTSSQDRIVAWEQELSQRALARAAAPHVKAVLVGDAADETHYGYSFLLAAAACSSTTSLLSHFGLHRRAALLQPHLQHRVGDVVDEFDDLDGVAFGDDLDQQRRATTSLIVQRWLPRLLHNGDLHTMAFGLEARVPFADRRVLHEAAAVDVVEGFVDGDVGEKRFLRTAVSPWLPKEIVQRRKSALPRDDAMGPLYRDAVHALLQSRAAVERLSTVFSPTALAALVAADKIDDVGRALLFTVLTVDGFLRHHAGA